MPTRLGSLLGERCNVALELLQPLPRRGSCILVTCASRWRLWVLKLNDARVLPLVTSFVP